MLHTLNHKRKGVQPMPPLIEEELKPQFEPRITHSLIQPLELASNAYKRRNIVIISVLHKPEPTILTINL